MYCFARGCTCHYSYHRCTFFRFPAAKDEFNKWEKLCRRQDRAPTTNDRLCSCHFKDGKKENGPTLFAHNKGKQFQFPDPEPQRKRTRASIPPHSAASEELIDQEAPVDPPLTEPTPESDHTYGFPCSSDVCRGKLENYQQEIKALAREIEELKIQNELLGKHRRFTIGDIKDDDAKMLLYTSFTFDVFMILSNLLKRFNLNYYYGWKLVSLSPEDQLLLTLMKLRLNLKDLDLAHRFCLSRAAVSNVIYTYVNAMHEILYKGITEAYMPSQRKCQGSQPQSFKDFASVCVIIDATEMTQDVPSNLNAQTKCYSSYKCRHTVKAVTGVAPNGALVYCSTLYPGSVSDQAIVEHSKFLDQLIPGDLILADKGFTIYDQLPQGVSLNIPPFLAGKTHLTRREADFCLKVGRSRIHIERSNERTKNFEILDHIPSHYRNISTKVFQVCSCLTNFQAPLIRECADGYQMGPVED